MTDDPTRSPSAITRRTALAGLGAGGFLDAFGNFIQTGTPRFGAGRTHVVGAGSRGVLFYHKTSGKGVGGFVSAGGGRTKTATYGQPLDRSRTALRPHREGV